MWSDQALTQLHPHHALGTRTQQGRKTEGCAEVSSCTACQLGLGSRMGESTHSCTAARAWHSEALWLSLSQTASRNQGRGKDKTSTE